MILEQVTELECRRCGHKWLPRKRDVRNCPKCQSAFWDQPRDDVNKLKCLRCGHEWESLDPKPRRCAKCKSPYWDKPKKEK